MTWTAPEAPTVTGSFTAPEREMVTTYVAAHRASLLRLCAGLTGEQLALRSVEPSRLSLLGLLRHMAKVERTWFRLRFAGQGVEPLHAPSEVGKDTDFEKLDPASAPADYETFVEECRLADEAVENASLDDTFVHNGELMSLRLIYNHMISEYSRHLGHADLLRERVDGATGL
ncbi:DUF664 domain-containing protein [Stackebrandtia soli]|uniref:mycothiol transferase n=1 Tax=Stackebrandtia soli TaxID=1892856 RepID=UPI0039EBB4AB